MVNFFHRIRVWLYKNRLTPDKMIAADVLIKKNERYHAQTNKGTATGNI
jgi:hypothetical protein